MIVCTCKRLPIFTDVHLLPSNWARCQHLRVGRQLGTSNGCYGDCTDKLKEPQFVICQFLPFRFVCVCTCQVWLCALLHSLRSTFSTSGHSILFLSNQDTHTQKRRRSLNWLSGQMDGGYISRAHLKRWTRSSRQFSYRWTVGQRRFTQLFLSVDRIFQFSLYLTRCYSTHSQWKSNTISIKTRNCRVAGASIFPNRFVETVDDFDMSFEIN